MLNPTKAFDVLLAEMIRPRFVRLQAILRELCPGVDDRKLNALSFSVIGQCFHYRVAGSFIEGLIGKDARASLDRDYLTDHITSFCLSGARWLTKPVTARKPKVWWLDDFYKYSFVFVRVETGKKRHVEAVELVRLASFGLLPRVFGRDDLELDDLAGRRALGDLIVQDDRQIVIAGGQVL